MADPGEAPPPPSFLDQTEARRAVKIFVWDWASPLIWGSGGLDAPFGPPPPPPHYLKVWISHCQWQVPLHTVSSQVHVEFNDLKRSISLFFFLCFAFSFWYDNPVWPYVIAYLLWFNFILNSNFIFICVTLFIIYHYTEKKNKGKYDLSQGLNKTTTYIFWRNPIFQLYISNASIATVAESF